VLNVLGSQIRISKLLTFFNLLSLLFLRFLGISHPDKSRKEIATEKVKRLKEYGSRSLLQMIYNRLKWNVVTYLVAGEYKLMSEGVRINERGR